MRKKNTRGDSHDRHAVHTKNWNAFRDYYHTLLNQITGNWPSDDTSYQIAEGWYLEESDKVVFASFHILKLYDHFRQAKIKAPLFDRYASEQVLQPEPCLSSDVSFAARLGHSSDTFPLARAQRDVVSHSCTSDNGDIIAVNGPPGTGKTTMLFSIVAVEWARAAMRGKEPPVIVAASTNNQAVTNILDAFAKNFSQRTGSFSGRWLPELKSFGTYLPSKAREEEASKKYQTESFFEKIETPAYVIRAKAAFIAAGARAFPDLGTVTVEAIVNELKSALHNEADKLQHLQNAWASLSSATASCTEILSHDPQSELAARQHKAAIISAQKIGIETLNRRWEEYQAQESILLSAFGWLPVVAKKRMQKARLFLRDIWPDPRSLESIRQFAEIENTIKADVRRLDQELSLQNQAVYQAQSLIHNQGQCQKQWDNTLTSIGLPLSNDFSEIDAETDKLVRFKIFLLTTHYWEGRWLLEMENNLPPIEQQRGKTGRKTIEAQWRRRTMLTPCAVSTLAMLPQKLRVRQCINDVYSDDYLYNYIDLLIIDEAGQVLPEVAGASFTLAKKAMVIGDTRQIEPIWAISQRVDLGSLLGSGII